MRPVLLGAEGLVRPPFKFFVGAGILHFDPAAGSLVVCVSVDNLLYVRHFKGRVELDQLAVRDFPRQQPPICNPGGSSSPNTTPNIFG